MGCFYQFLSVFLQESPGIHVTLAAATRASCFIYFPFSLFIFQDDFPLASLPLIGYLVDLPAPVSIDGARFVCGISVEMWLIGTLWILLFQADQIDKELVFKLQYKSHVYFFRADNEYSFFR